MTTFTTEDRLNAAPPHIVDSGASVQIRDVEFPGFVFRFNKQGDEWVCTMPGWLLDSAIEVAQITAKTLKNVQK
jgi:hypothetical protein